MDIQIDMNRNIARKVLRTLPYMAKDNGQIIVRSDRGALILQSTDGIRVSYSYLPSDINDVSTSGSGKVDNITDKVIDLAIFLLEGKDGQIVDSMDTNPPRVKGGYSNEDKYTYNDDRYSSHYVPKTYSPLGRTAEILMALPNESVDNTDDFLDVNTYQGGNQILMGGDQATRSYHSLGREDGTLYGDGYDLMEANLNTKLSISQQERIDNVRRNLGLSPDATFNGGVIDTSSDRAGYGDITAKNR